MLLAYWGLKTVNWSLINPTEILEINSAVFRVPRTLHVGHSFFLPSLKHQKTFNAVRLHYYNLAYTLTWAERIEGGVLGIRVWRVA